MPTNKSFTIRSTGCGRRTQEAAKLHQYFIKNNYKYTEDILQAHIVIFVTCAFTQTQEIYSLNMIKRCQKVALNTKHFIVAGCLPAVNKDLIKTCKVTHVLTPQTMEKINDLFPGTEKWEEITEGDILNQHNGNYTSHPAPLQKPFTRKWLLKTVNEWISHAIRRLLKSELGVYGQVVDYKNAATMRIATGCIGSCSYCCIRFATGKLKSEPIESLRSKCLMKLDAGQRIINLQGEDTGAYGLDIGTNIIDLLKELLTIERNFELSVHDFHPRWIITYHKEIKQLLHLYPRKFRRIEIPLQSGSNEVLERMNRPYDVDIVIDHLKEFLAIAPHLRLSTHFIVGFPGETDCDVVKTQKAMHAIPYESIYVFRYEARPQTAAASFPDQIPEPVASKRLRHLKKHVRIRFLSYCIRFFISRRHLLK